MNVTTTHNGIRREDCTFHNSREQKEILNEGVTDKISEKGDGALNTPVSLTPEQAKRYFQEQAESSNTTSAKTFFLTMIKWIDELEQFRREKTKQIWKQTQQEHFDETVEDI